MDWAGVFPRLQWLGCAAGAGSAAHGLQRLFANGASKQLLFSAHTLSNDAVRVDRMGVVFRCAESLLAAEGDWAALQAAEREEWRRLGWAGAVRRSSLFAAPAPSAADDSADELASIFVAAITAAQRTHVSSGGNSNGSCAGDSGLLQRCFDAAPDAVTAELQALLRDRPQLAAKLFDRSAAVQAPCV